MNSDKLVILAGGISSRMKQSNIESSNLSEELLNDAVTKPKSMIRLGEEGKPFLDYLLMNAILAGFKKIVIVINERDNSIRNYYEEHSEEYIRMNLGISFAYQKIIEGRTKPLGTADALLQGLLSQSEWDNSKIVMCNSDNLYSVNAFKQIRNSEFPNALIDYERDSLGVEAERVSKFSVTLKDDERYLLDIIEKPTEDEIEKAKDMNGFVGISMNLFSFSYDMIIPFLERVPMNKVRLEKELPTVVKMMVNENPKSLFCYPWKERVPDLTNQNDIYMVQKFIKNELSTNN